MTGCRSERHSIPMTLIPAWHPFENLALGTANFRFRSPPSSAGPKGFVYLFCEQSSHEQNLVYRSPPGRVEPRPGRWIGHSGYRGAGSVHDRSDSEFEAFPEARGNALARPSGCAGGLAPWSPRQNPRGVHRGHSCSSTGLRLLIHREDTSKLDRVVARPPILSGTPAPLAGIGTVFGIASDRPLRSWSWASIKITSLRFYLTPMGQETCSEQSSSVYSHHPDVARIKHGPRLIHFDHIYSQRPLH